MFPSAPTLSTVSALPFSLSFPFPTDTPSSRSSAPSSVSSSSSHSSVSSSVASSSPQSYRASPLSSLSNSSYWENEDQHESAPPRTHCCTHKSVQVTFRTSVTADFLSSNLPYNTRSEVQSDAVPIEQRQHPRRTHRLIHVNSKSGNASAPASRAPPALVRQSERKEVFVDSLVGKPISCRSGQVRSLRFLFLFFLGDRFHNANDRNYMAAFGAIRYSRLLIRWPGSNFNRASDFCARSPQAFENQLLYLAGRVILLDTDKSLCPNA